MSIIHSSTMQLIAQFPACSCCEGALIRPVSDAAVWVRVRDDPPLRVNRSEAAAFLRFLADVSPHAVTKQHLYHALGECMNVSRVNATLRRRFGREIIIREDRPKVGGSGSFGAFYLPDYVRVRAVDSEAGR